MGKITTAAAPLTLYQKAGVKRYDLIMTEQVLHILQKTPAKHIYQRKGKGGQTWDYVTGTYVKKTLNYVFGWNWDFEITDKGREQDQVWVLGKLSVKDDAGHVIVKSQFGRADIKFLRETKTMVDYGNDLKAAATDSLKNAPWNWASLRIFMARPNMWKKVLRRT